VIRFTPRSEVTAKGGIMEKITGIACKVRNTKNNSGNNITPISVFKIDDRLIRGKFT
jgi:hypothetical protein